MARVAVRIKSPAEFGAIHQLVHPSAPGPCLGQHESPQARVECTDICPHELHLLLAGSDDLLAIGNVVSSENRSATVERILATFAWSAPENPRWAFAAEPMLSKLYIVRETGGVAVDPKEDPCAQFLSLLLPELDRVMSPSGQATGAKTPDKLK